MGSGTTRGSVVARIGVYLRDGALLLPLLLLVGMTLLVVSPAGDFPLNDDWVYHKAVERLLADGYYRGHPFTAAILVAQVYWGALVAKLFGLSYETLRYSTIFLSALCLWGTAQIAREFGLSRPLALLCAALLWANPIYLSLTYSFMTDIPFFTATVWSGYFYLRSLRSPTAYHAVFLGSLFAAVATLVRQFGIFLPLAYMAATGWFVLRRRYAVNWKTIGAFAAPLLAGALFFLYIETTRERYFPMDAAWRSTGFLDTTIRWLRHLVIALTYLGLFLLPVAAARFWEALRGPRKWRFMSWAALGGFCAVSLMLVWYVAFRRMPFQPSYLYDLGVGPRTLYDFYVEKKFWTIFRVGRVWWPITVAALASGGIVAAATWRLLRKAVHSAREKDEAEAARTRQGAFLFAWGAAMVIAPFNPWFAAIYDRYFLAGLVPFGLLTIRYVFDTDRRVSHAIAWTGVACFYVFGVIALQDYFAWNHAQWRALNMLMDTYDVKPEEIAGSFEFNGVYTSEAFVKARDSMDFFEQGDIGIWAFDDTYVLGYFAPRPGYEIFLREPYFTWLGMETRYVYVFKRTPAE